MALFDYKFVLEVARHGARSPSIIYPLALNADQNF